MIILKENNILLNFDELKGEIISLNDGIKEYVKEVLPVFEVSLRDVNGKQIIVSAADMECTESDCSAAGFSASYKGTDVSVEISAEITDEIKWFINASADEKYVLEWVNYPQIAVPNDLSKDKTGSKILWGFNEGVEVSSMDEREIAFGYIEPEYPATGVMGMYPAIVETQFMAYYNGRNGLYFAAHDADDYLKGVDFYRYNDEGVKLQFRHFCGCEFGEKFTLAYPMVMKFFAGGWEDASEIYRVWFKNNKAKSFVPPICENKKLPKWYGESPVIITYPVRGLHDTDEMLPNKLFPYINVMPHVERLEKELDSKIMVILMHWEGTAPWAPPYVWPPFGGEEEFKKLVDALHERGDVIGVYCSGLGWTVKSNLDDYETSEEFEKNNLKDEMCLSPEQELPYSKICTDQRVGYDMCPTRDFTKKVIKNEVDKMVSSGLDYIQLLDQNHGGTAYFCYSKNHGHAPVPGKWQVDAVKELMGDITAKYDNVLFGCESAAAEGFIPYLLFSDNRFNLNYLVGKQVPAYAYIFHEYLNNFMGNQVCVNYWIEHEKSPINILERFAYSFSAGDMLTLVLNQDGDIYWNWGNLDGMAIPEQESIKQFVKNANYWRQNFGKYLHTGKMVKAWEVECDENIIYRKEGRTPIYRPKIHTSAWNATDGSTGQILINYNKEDTDCTVKLPEGEYTVYEYGKEPYTISGGVKNITIDKLSSILVVK